MRGQKKVIANFIIPYKYLVHTARMRDTNTNSYNINTQYISIKIMKSSSSDIQKKKGLDHMTGQQVHLVL